MAEIILDFNERPPVTTYNHHAFGTGIISSYEYTYFRDRRNSKWKKII